MLAFGNEARVWSQKNLHMLEHLSVLGIIEAWEEYRQRTLPCAPPPSFQPTFPLQDLQVIMARALNCQEPDKIPAWALDLSDRMSAVTKVPEAIKAYRFGIIVKRVG